MRIIYWNTACLQPEIEAISKEIFQLSRHFKKSWIFSISSHYCFRLSIKNRYIGFNYKFDPVLRMLIPLIEQGCDVNHVYGEPCPWIFYKTLKRRPLILTVAAEKGMPRLDFLARCQKIIVQTATFQKRLWALGIEQHKVELMYPAVDFTIFRPRESVMDSREHPKILFATAPRSEEELAGRGVYLLLEAAKLSPDVHYRLLYRKWNSGYTSLPATETAIRIHQLNNVILTNSIVHDMPAVYNEHHFTIIPYTTHDGGKECPNSLVEGLSCGLPVLISSVSPFAYFVDEQKCGVVFEPKPACLVQAVEIGMRKYAELSKNAIRASREYFSQQLLIARLEKIYQDISRGQLQRPQKTGVTVVGKMRESG